MYLVDWMALFREMSRVMLVWVVPKVLCHFDHGLHVNNVPRRNQLSWWTPECFATCVARNGKA